MKVGAIVSQLQDFIQPNRAECVYLITEGQVASITNISNDILYGHIFITSHGSAL